MEKFTSLPEDRQNQIINGALKSFSLNGYKKTSVSDIAAEAGISKAMVFHYFGTKKDLYLYLMEFCIGLVMDAINERFDRSITDFFERINMAASIKISAMEKQPSSLSFLSSVYFEKDEEIKSDIKIRLEMSEGIRSKLAFEGMDVSKFKAGVDPKLVMKILDRYTEGFINALPSYVDFDLDSIMEEFNECFQLLRNNFYKEEFL